jgi:hypothetical protein
LHTVIPAPINGMDARVNVASDNMEVCLVADNLIPSEYGMRVRPGYRVWQENIGLPDEVRTVIPFAGVAEGGTDDRLFAVTNVGIYDVTVQNAAPVLKLSFLSSLGDAGFGTYAHYVDQNGTDVLYYADGENGLHEYDEILDTWAIATGISSVVGATAPLVLANVVFIVSHKLRLWLVEKESTKGWYLPILSAKGEASEFFFAGKFKHGGELVGLYNWTVDGGAGRDDHLVAISRAGDVIPFTGDDPSSADTWQNTGTFYIGDIPRGNRICSEYGADLYMLSTFGLTSMRDLLSGRTVSDITATSIGYRIARLLREDLKQLRDAPGWDIKFVTHEGLMMISVPQLLNGKYRQYVYSLAVGGWGRWDNVPLVSSDPWLGELMVGTKDGRVLRMDVEQDEVDGNGEGGIPIMWYVLTSYTTLESPAAHKRVNFIRPNFNAQQEPTYECTALYDYSINEPLPVLVEGSDAPSLWDSALWNEDTWGVGAGQPFFSLQGGSGMGRTVAIAMVGSSSVGTFVGSWDISWTEGGLL